MTLTFLSMAYVTSQINHTYFNFLQFFDDGCESLLYEKDKDNESLDGPLKDFVSFQDILNSSATDTMKGKNLQYNNIETTNDIPTPNDKATFLTDLPDLTTSPNQPSPAQQLCPVACSRPNVLDPNKFSNSKTFWVYLIVRSINSFFMSSAFTLLVSIL